MDNLGNSRNKGSPGNEHEQCVALVACASHFCHELNNMMMIIDGNVRRLMREDDQDKRMLYQEKVTQTLTRLQTEVEALTQTYRPLKQQFFSEVQEQLVKRP